MPRKTTPVKNEAHISATQQTNTPPKTCQLHGCNNPMRVRVGISGKDYTYCSLLCRALDHYLNNTEAMITKRPSDQWGRVWADSAAAVEQFIKLRDERTQVWRDAGRREDTTTPQGG